MIFITFENPDKTCSKIDKTTGWQKQSSEWKNPEAVVQRCSVNKGFLKTLLNSHENTCPGVSIE